MRATMRCWMMPLAVLLLALSAFSPASAAPQSEPTEPGTEAGVSAYRAGDYAAAMAAWKSQLQGAQTPGERVRLAYNIGNAAYRMGDQAQAVGWYTAALRHAPRDSALWHNLELARSSAGLEPADKGDLDATLHRLVSALTLPESEGLALACLALLALALAGEALRGGTLWRRLTLGAATLFLASLLPYAWNLSQQDSEPMLVLAQEGAAGRKMPSRTATVLTTLEAGTQVQRLDALPDWVQVRTAAGEELWVRDTELFDLRL